ncbi:response regulator transcription factor [Poseidonibacter sp.]|uniref:response regulator transcription factor n=1 Tax=Poseidonibacter sp. TaxID=2321188 RepID=UPI003C7891CE
MNENLINKLSAYTVLYVEDEAGIRRNIEEILQHLFKETYSAKNVSEAHLKYLQYKPDLIITDIRMPGDSGIDLIKKVRESDSKTRVIITSAHTDLEYLLQVAELHLVKYIVKPITQEKLLDALEAFLKTHEDSKIYNLNATWVFDYSKSVISNETQEFDLTKKESNFLKLLITKNRLISYEEMENLIWDEDSVMTPNAMRLFIKNFRKKLPNKIIKNVQGIGYKLSDESDN